MYVISSLPGRVMFISFVFLTSREKKSKENMIITHEGFKTFYESHDSAEKFPLARQ